MISCFSSTEKRLGTRPLLSSESMSCRKESFCSWESKMRKTTSRPWPPAARSTRLTSSRHSFNPAVKSTEDSSRLEAILSHYGSETALKLLWNSYETALKLLWNCSELIWNCSETALKLLWNSYETTLKLVWNCTEIALQLLWKVRDNTHRNWAWPSAGTAWNPTWMLPVASRIAGPILRRRSAERGLQECAELDWCATDASKRTWSNAQSIEGFKNQS